MSTSLTQVREIDILNPARGAVFMVTSAVLGVIVPFVLLAAYPLTIDLTNLLQMLVVFYATLRLAKLLSVGIPLWFDTIFWTFTYIFIGLAGIVQRAAQQNPYKIDFSESSLQNASLLALLGMIAYDVVQKGSVKHFRRSLTSRPQRVLSTHRVNAIMWVALIVTPIVVMLLGGFDTLLLTRTERVEGLAQAGLFTDDSKVRGGILLTMSYALPLVASVAAISALHQDPTLKRRTAWVAGIAILVPVTLFVANPVSTSRFWTGTILLSFIFTLRYANTRRGYRIIASATILALLVLFPYADYFRYRDSVATRGLGLGSLMARKGDYDGATQMVSAIDYVALNGITNGQQTLGFLTFFIPRSIWPEKPGATGALLSSFVGYPQANVSSPLWTEGYIDGGVFGVVAAFTLLALASNWLQAERRSYNIPMSWPTLLMPMAAGYIAIVLRGSLLSSAAGLFMIVLLSFLTTRRPEEKLANKSLEKAVSGQRSASIRPPTVGHKGVGFTRRRYPQ